MVSAPLLAREFGGYAALAMILLILVAAAIGWTLRYNIRVVETELQDPSDKVLHSLETLSHYVLAFAYFISITYYLSLLGAFVLESLGRADEGLACTISLALVIGIGVLGWTGGAARVAGLERYATTLNLAIISGFLISLAAFCIFQASAGQSIAPPPGKFEVASLPVLLGLLIVVQGFETTRFTGDAFDAETRARAMTRAQVISGVIYIAFFLLLSPLLADLAQGTGVAAVITGSASVAAILPIALTLGAAASQLSASVADSDGDVGLIRDLSKGRVDARHAYALIAGIGVAILYGSNVEEIIAYASRAFALFYAIQCLVAFESARKRPEHRAKAPAFLALALVAGAVFLLGVPAE